MACAALLMRAAPASAADGPTFNRDIAPLIHAHCSVCHQPEGDAPFSLLSYQDVRSRLTQVRQVTAARIMPPWQPSSDSPPFVGRRGLSPDDINLIARWVADGAPEGETRAEAFTAGQGGWQWGAPDLVLALPRYTLRADGSDLFRHFVVRIPDGPRRYVRALQFRPQSPAVHHANIRIDPTPASRALDARDPEPGYEGVTLHSAVYPDGHFLGWTPGQNVAPRDDLAWPLDGGTDFVVQLHLRPTGRVETLSPVIGLYLTEVPAPRRPALIRLGRQDLAIPAEDSHYQSADSFVLPRDAQIVGVQAHAHYRAREVLATALLPDGSRRTLLHIPAWDFNWQDQYRLASPFWLPAGTRLELRYTFDNSHSNPRNPTVPPQDVRWGWRTEDEMADLWVQVFTRNDADRVVLQEAARLKGAAEDAIGAEAILRREPDHVDLHNDAAQIYLELGDRERALAHFSAVARLQPGSPAAMLNEGVVLEELGRIAEAVARYDAALKIDPVYVPAHRRLAARSYLSGDIDRAIDHYRWLTTHTAPDASTSCSLARALNEAGRIDDSLAEYGRGLAIDPASLACLINLSWLRSAHASDTVRRPAEAVRLAQRSVEISKGPEALDALASALASAGDFPGAVDAAQRAVLLSIDPLRSAIIGRLALYRQGRAFVVRD